MSVSGCIWPMRPHAPNLLSCLTTPLPPLPRRSVKAAWRSSAFPVQRHSPSRTKVFCPIGKNSLKPSAAPTHTIQYGKIVRRRPGAWTKCCWPFCARRARLRAKTPSRFPVMAAFCPRNSCWTRCWKTARGWPSRANLPGAPFSTAGLISRRPRPSPI